MVMLQDFNKKDEEDVIRDNYTREVNEAIVAGERALDSLNAAKSKLSTASGWGLFDMLGGGFFSTLIKQSNMKDAKYYMEKARRDLKDFSKELGDLDFDEDLDIQTDDFLSFADVFFDSFVFDVLVQSRISNAKYKLQEAIDRVGDILEKIK